jgi:hypothetical protein
MTSEARAPEIVFVLRNPNKECSDSEPKISSGLFPDGAVQVHMAPGCFRSVVQICGTSLLPHESTVEAGTLQLEIQGTVMENN